MKNYLKHAKKYWYCFLLGPLFMIMEAAGEIILPYINANIIKRMADQAEDAKKNLSSRA